MKQKLSKYFSKSDFSGLIIVVVIWALELFLVQELTFSFDYPVPVLKQVGSKIIRLLLDIFFCAGCTFLLSRYFLIAFFSVFALFAQISVCYKAVFGRALTLTTIKAQWGEGIIGAKLDWEYINGYLLFCLLFALIVKVLLLLRKDRSLYQKKGVMVWVGVCAWMAYVCVATVSMLRVDSPLKLRSFVSGDRLGMTYGYILLWSLEGIYLNQSQLLREAVERRGMISDNLLSQEKPVSLGGDIILIQVESLDWRILNHCAYGKPVMPFLNQIIDKSMLFKVTALHPNGSGDTDFVMLNAVLPSSKVMTYVLKDYPYSNTLPQIAKQAGYETAVLHGNNGSFFLRDRAFKRMGFDNIWFLEEMRDSAALPVGLWGIRDDKVLSFSQMCLHKNPKDQKKLHYIITLTSHQPFTYLDPEQCVFLPGHESMSDRYCENMNFVDRSLANYIQGLDDKTLVVIFGDHRAMVNIDGLACEDRGLEHVPFIIYQKGKDLSKEQKSRGTQLATSGKLTMLDAALYVHGLFKPKLEANNALDEH